MRWVDFLFHPFWIRYFRRYLTFSYFFFFWDFIFLLFCWSTVDIHLSHQKAWPCLVSHCKIQTSVGSGGQVISSSSSWKFFYPTNIYLLTVREERYFDFKWNTNNQNIQMANFHFVYTWKFANIFSSFFFVKLTCLSFYVHLCHFMLIKLKICVQGYSVWVIYISVVVLIDGWFYEFALIISLKSLKRRFSVIDVGTRCGKNYIFSQKSSFRLGNSFIRFVMHNIRSRTNREVYRNWEWILRAT